jgi:tetratricopeptide (TPR) repeat protein
LRHYAASYGGFLSSKQLDREIELQKIVLEYDSENVGLARRIGKLLMTKGDWPEAVRVMEPFESTNDARLLRDLGVAICKRHRQQSTGKKYRRGQTLLEKAIEEEPGDADAIASLAGTWKGLDDEKARDLYRRAFEIDPSDPYPLGNYLAYEIAHRGDTRIVSLMAPSMRQAIRRCRDQAAVNMNMPWAYYDIGKFELLLGNASESLAAYARAVQVSLSEAPIESALATNESLQDAVGRRLPEAEWVRRFLLVARVAKLMEMHAGGEADPGIERKSEDALKDLRDEGGLATKGAEAIRGPVLIVAGGTDPGVQQRMEAYRGLLTQAFKGFNGTVLSGGTTAGICGLVGELGEASESITTLGYVPQDPLPNGAEIDTRYSEIRRTSGQGFTPLGPLQNWIDLLASGIEPGDVKVLGINGGEIAALEYRFALALGARVGIVEESGREAAKLLVDDEWLPSEHLVQLPADPMTLRAFVGPGSPKLPPDQREILARSIHEKYLQNRLRTLQQGLPEWEELSAEFRESSAQQADHISEKLRQIEYEIHDANGREPVLVKFEDDEVEFMAETEHGRWNVERLLDGWRWGPEKNVQKKISPYLVSWEELPDDIREYDRETVREIPENLAKLGLEIRKTG